MSIIDMHCHILPGVDDGAKDLGKYRTIRAAVWRATFSHPQPANSLTYRQ
jgi:hypothetical protein